MTISSTIKEASLFGKHAGVALRMLGMFLFDQTPAVPAMLMSSRCARRSKTGSMDESIYAKDFEAW